MTHRPLRSAPIALAALAASLALTLAPANAAEMWLHIRVEERGESRENVRVNLPLSLIESVAPVVEATVKENSGITIGDKDWNTDRFREVWKSVRAATDGEYVTIESDDETVRVAKKGNHITVKTSSTGQDTETVDVKVPLAVVDALFSGPEGTLNIAAAVQALRGSGAGELVSVSDGSSRVRIWIDATGTEE